MLAEEPDHLTLRYLRNIDVKLDRLTEEVGEFKQRAQSLERNVVILHQGITNMHDDNAGLQTQDGSHR